MVSFMPDEETEDNEDWMSYANAGFGIKMLTSVRPPLNNGAVLPNYDKHFVRHLLSSRSGIHQIGTAIDNLGKFVLTWKVFCGRKILQSGVVFLEGVGVGVRPLLTKAR